MRHRAMFPVLDPLSGQPFVDGPLEKRTDPGPFGFDLHGLQRLVRHGSLNQLELAGLGIDPCDEDSSSMHRRKAHDVLGGFLRCCHDHRHVLNPSASAEMMASLPGTRQLGDTLRSSCPGTTSWHLYCLHLVHNFPRAPIGHGARTGVVQLQG